jgi:hypothetical protein
MAEHYLNILTVRLRGYAGRPLPENLIEAVSLTVTVGAQLDLEQLADAVREDLAAGPRRIQQTYTETRWGATGSEALLLVDVPTVVTGVASLTALWEVISRRVLDHGQPKTVPGETAAASARTMVAESLDVGADRIRIVGLKPVGDCHRVDLETPQGPFTVEIDNRGVSLMRRY